MVDKRSADEGVLSRWSRKKLEPHAEHDDETTPSPPEQQQDTEQDQELTNENNDSTLAEDAVPIWQQEGVEADTKKSALAALFRQPEFQEVDHMNEYDEDFTSFNPLGKLVTQEMKRMLTLAEQKTRPEAEDIKLADDEVERTSSQQGDDNHNNEDDKLA